MTAEEMAKGLHILQHSLGLDAYGQGKSYRNRFATGEGSVDHPICTALVAEGLMTVRKGVPDCGDMDFFFVTDLGRAYVANNSPPPPKISASKRRYMDYLASECSLTFGEWLKWRTRLMKEQPK